MKRSSHRLPNAAPPIHRGSMVPVPWRGFFAGLRDMLLSPRDGGSFEPLLPWQRAAARRRRTLMLLVALSAMGAAALMLHVQPASQAAPLRLLQVGLFTLLFAWVAAGFFTAMMGVVVQLFGDRHAMSAQSVRHLPLGPDATTAVIMPICNEQVETVFANVRATAESLIAEGGARLFDFYVLSDTSDGSVRAAEEAAFVELRARLAAGGARLHYRWRQRRTRRKAGNVADFCRRWGRNHRYMVVLDADSVMSGEALLGLVRLMEAHPRAGIIQTAPASCGLNTLHARAQQFAGRVAGRLFTAGMQYWQLGESHYWGHNAIIRVAPFMQHCALATLPGRGGLSGDIMSHDFVEAALMRRAGYHVWLVTDLQGSYEQQPPSLLEELNRDRRWCQGNLQNARLITEPGLQPVHRAMLVTGAMAYLSAPLWLGFVLLGTGMWLFGGYNLFTPAGAPLEVFGLWSLTVAMLALPRVMGIAAVIFKGEQAQFGGSASLIRGTLIEGALSVLQAPVRMVAHTMFVVVALTGLKLAWKSPPREASAVAWRDAIRHFAPVTAMVLALFAGMLAIDPTAAVWLAPIGLPLLLAAPLTVLTSQLRVGEALRGWRLLLIPEETATPSVLTQSWTYARTLAPTTAATEADDPVSRDLPLLMPSMPRVAAPAAARVVTPVVQPVLGTVSAAGAWRRRTSGPGNLPELLHPALALAVHGNRAANASRYQMPRSTPSSQPQSAPRRNDERTPAIH